MQGLYETPEPQRAVAAASPNTDDAVVGAGTRAPASGTANRFLQAPPQDDTERRSGDASPNRRKFCAVDGRGLAAAVATSRHP